MTIRHVQMQRYHSHVHTSPGWQMPNDSLNDSRLFLFKKKQIINSKSLLQCRSALCDNPHLDQRGVPRAHFPAKCAATPAIPFIADHAAARRIACVATPPSRDASPTPNMYHPS
jgi:hypothetical protein